MLSFVIMETLSEEQKNYLRNIYFNPAHPVSFQSPPTLFKFVQRDGKYKIKFKLIKKWLNNQESYSINKNVQRNFQRGRVLVSGIDDQWDADLISMIPYGQYNNGFNYMLCIIDIFSRFAWVVPLKTKEAQEVIRAFKSVLRKGRRPQRLRTDAGSEFKNKYFAQFMKDEKINHFFTHNEKQANYVERFIQTLKRKIYRLMKELKTNKYINHVPQLVSGYNGSFHSGIQAVPEQVNETNETKLWWQMYWPKEPAPLPGVKTPRKRKCAFLFQVGDKVRMTLTKTAFQREYSARWSEEIFIIADRFIRQDLCMYKLKDWAGEPIEGTFYQAELQETTEPPVFEIEQRVKKKVKGKRPYFHYKGTGANRKVLVSWKGWPSKFNSYVLVSSLPPGV